MGLFRRSREKQRPPLVGVVFTDPLADASRGARRLKQYAYRWPLRERPVLGHRVMVMGSDGLTPVVVVDTAAKLPAGFDWSDMKPVVRTLTADEVPGEEDARAAYLDMARAAAGLPVGSSRRNPPAGFPELPPVRGIARGAKARERGNLWWRLRLLARDAEEDQAFRAVATYWYERDPNGQSRWLDAAAAMRRRCEGPLDPRSA